MVALQIRDVPEEIRDALAAQARANGQSLQAFLLDLVRRQALRANNTAQLDRFTGRHDGIVTAPGELAQLIGEQRAQREEGLSG